MPAMIAAMSASPPMTPPTMAPTGVDLGVGGGVGDGVGVGVGLGVVFERLVTGVEMGVVRIIGESVLDADPTRTGVNSLPICPT